MKKLTFETSIAAGRQKVWDTMLAPDTYKQWADVSWPGSSYEGEWKPEADLWFTSPGQGGTKATITALRPYEYILAEHTAVINKDGTEDRNSDVAKGWIGTTESYTFTENNGKTTLKVEINTFPEWADMFADGWPNALARLKEICES